MSFVTVVVATFGVMLRHDQMPDTERQMPQSQLPGDAKTLTSMAPVLPPEYNTHPALQRTAAQFSKATEEMVAFADKCLNNA